MMRCKHCGHAVLYDGENDLIHVLYENNGVDARMCEPTNPDSKIAEEIKRTEG